jgi:LysM repeat protein
VTCALAVVLVVRDGGSSDDKEPSTATAPSPRSTGTATSTATTTTTTRSRPSSTSRSRPESTEAPRIYVIKAGDLLSTIAAATGVSVAEIERLNPEVDATALQPGQKLRLSR